jgi:acetoin utilization deacetylase AcuC-like enzyme
MMNMNALIDLVLKSEGYRKPNYHWTDKELEIINGKARVYQPEPAIEDDLYSVHTKDYVQFVKDTCEKGIGYLDYGDTPAKRGFTRAHVASWEVQS